MGPDNVILLAASWIVPLIIAIVFHEISHGWVANAFGDPTARRLGRLSPNPIRHVDPVGTVALPMVLAMTGAPVFGWAKPVPVTARRLRNPRVHMMLVALAGPGMNLLLALVGAFALAALRTVDHEAGGAWAFLLMNLGNFIMINVFLAVFNLLPIPPFDGGHVVEGLLPRRLAVHFAKLKRFGFLLLIVLLLAVPMLFPKAHVVERLVLPPVRLLLRLVSAIAGLG
ncbi:MAG TPA: site-2 protease family protein [Allosphingosinicella sp.]